MRLALLVRRYSNHYLKLELPNNPKAMGTKKWRTRSNEARVPNVKERRVNGKRKNPGKKESERRKWVPSNSKKIGRSLKTSGKRRNAMHVDVITTIILEMGCEKGTSAKALLARWRLCIQTTNYIPANSMKKKSNSSKAVGEKLMSG